MVQLFIKRLYLLLRTLCEATLPESAPDSIDAAGHRLLFRLFPEQDKRKRHLRANASLKTSSLESAFAWQA